MFLMRWIARRIEDKRRQKQRQEFQETRDLQEYYEDQVTRLNAEIDVRHTELMGLIMVRNTLNVRAETFHNTASQIEAQYRQA